MSALDLRSHAVPKISLASMGASTDDISDRAELDTFARQFSTKPDYMFSMGYSQQKSCAEVIGFCDMFRTFQKHRSVSATERVELSDLTAERS